MEIRVIAAFAGILLIIIGILLIIVWYAIVMQRKLVHADELVSNALSQIGVQQNSRWDALTALVELTKNYTEYESQTLMNIIQQRLPMTKEIAQMNQQENLLTQARGSIMAIAENYPQLQANITYIEMMRSVNTYEENVRMSRMVYNDSATKMNRLVRAFPGSIFAKMFGFGVREYLEEPTEKTQMPSMKIG